MSLIDFLNEPEVLVAIFLLGMICSPFILSSFTTAKDFIEEWRENKRLSAKVKGSDASILLMLYFYVVSCLSYCLALVIDEYGVDLKFQFFVPIFVTVLIFFLYSFRKKKPPKPE